MQLVRKRPAVAVALFSFPKEQRKLWINRIGQHNGDPSFEPPNSGFVRFDHFAEGDSYHNQAKKRKLLPGAIPIGKGKKIKLSKYEDEMKIECDEANKHEEQLDCRNQNVV